MARGSTTSGMEIRSLRAFPALFPAGAIATVSERSRTFASGLIDRREQLDHRSAVSTGHKGRTVVAHRPEKVLDLQPVVVRRGVDLGEAFSILGLKLGE